MKAPITMSVEEARATLEHLRVVTDGADASALAPVEWIKRLNQSARTVAPREVQHRYRLDGVLGVTMGRLSRGVTALLNDFDALVEDNPRLTRKAR